jgi:hypothetical protein
VTTYFLKRLTFSSFIYESRKPDNKEHSHSVSNNNHQNMVMGINYNLFIKYSSIFRSDHYVGDKYMSPGEYNKVLYQFEVLY